MNSWLDYSIKYANQRSYLDDLFKVYPTIPEGLRDIDSSVWANVERHYAKKDNIELVKELLKLDLFPIKDSYVAYLRRDSNSISRNPQTINRIAGRVYDMGLEKLFERCSEPKETNRQIGPMFKNWVNTKALGIQPVKLSDFTANDNDAILDGSDAEMMKFASDNLNYKHEKGLDFVGRFNKKYVIGETKFLTDFGGHQNAQFNDAISTLEADADAVKIGILDGVLYIPGNHKMYKNITEKYQDRNIMSCLVLPEFLYSI